MPLFVFAAGGPDGSRPAGPFSPDSPATGGGRRGAGVDCASFVMLRSGLPRIVVAVPTARGPDEHAGGDAAGATAIDEAERAPSRRARGDELPAATLQRFREKDPDALGEVYDRYRRAVWAVALSITRADHLAQEAVQEIFIRAWNAAATYDPTRDLGPWLMTIARHASLDLIRRELRPTRGGHEAETDVVVEETGIDEVWLSWEIQEALRRLSDDEREIVRLSFFEDLTQVQVAARLGLPLGTVKSRSHRAHRRLAELLKHLREEPAMTLNHVTPPHRTETRQMPAEGGDRR
jgi:RNA polymerase sigma-70 factor (ECF subfamily)